MPSRQAGVSSMGAMMNTWPLSTVIQIPSPPKVKIIRMAVPVFPT